MDGASETRVLIVGEDPLARGGLAVLLVGEAGLLVVGQAAPGAQAAAAVAGLQPDAVVWDLGLSPRGLPEMASLTLHVLRAGEPRTIEITIQAREN